MYQAVILGIIQGLTEFLPVSSSGHLVLFQHLFGLSEPQLFFDISLHVGTLLAVALIYLKEIKGMINAFFKLMVSVFKNEKTSDILATDPDARLFYLIVLGSIPTGVIGLFLKNYADTIFSSITVVGCMLIITGILLWVTRKRTDTHLLIKDVSPKKAFIIGTIQGLAVMPGISRSGSTIAAGLFMGLERETAARYSFLLSMPAIMAAEFIGLIDGFSTDFNINSLTAVGTATAFITGYMALRVLLKIVKKGRLHLFAFYCWAIGILAVFSGVFF